MKNFLRIIISLFFLTSSCFAIEEINQQENTLEGQVNLNEIDDEAISLEEKTEPTFKDKYFEDLEFSVVYMGNFNIQNVQRDEPVHTLYSARVLDLTVKGVLADKKTYFLGRINPLREVEHYSYFPAMFSDFYMGYKINKNQRVHVGQVRTALGYEGEKIEYTLPFVNRSQLTRTFGNVRTFGVTNKGNYKYMDYNIGIYDSTRFLQEPFHGAEFVSWVNFTPLAKFDDKYGKITIGGGYSGGKHDSQYNVVGACLGYDYKKFFSMFEYANANGYNGIRRSTNKAEGFYTTFGYKIHPKVDIVTRYDYFNPNKAITHNSSEEYSIGLNYHLKNNKFRTQLNYVWQKNQMAKDTGKILFQTLLMI